MVEWLGQVVAIASTAHRHRSVPLPATADGGGRDGSARSESEEEESKAFVPVLELVVSDEELQGGSIFASDRRCDG
jgi:hypothetical protein